PAPCSCLTDRPATAHHTLSLHDALPILDDDPWTPLRRPVASATVALVATGGVHLRTDPPFNPHGDGGFRAIPRTAEPGDLQITQDRKSTRLNSSHQIISYAVFCLQKQTK